MLIVDNDDFFGCLSRLLLPLRHALGRSLISLQGARRIGPHHSCYWEALYSYAVLSHTTLALYWEAPSFVFSIGMMRCIIQTVFFGLSIFLRRIGPHHSCYWEALYPNTAQKYAVLGYYDVLGHSFGLMLCIIQTVFLRQIGPHHSTFSIGRLCNTESGFLRCIWILCILTS